VKNGALIVAVSFRGISERHEVLLILPEELKCLSGVLFQDDNHEGTHEEGCIGKLIRLVAAVVEDAVVLVLIILYRHRLKLRKTYL
jgi:hypothetical protein